VHVDPVESGENYREAIIDQATGGSKLRSMRHRRLTFLITALAVASCTSGESGTARTRSRVVAGDSSAGSPAVPWFEGAVPIVLVPAHSNDRALVVSADSLAPDLEEGALQEPITIVRLDGSLSTVHASLSSGSEGCVDAALQPAPSAGWGVGFVGKPPTAIAVDSIRSISRQDSIALTPLVFRLASTVPNTVGGRFAGLPFSLADLWRIRRTDGPTIIVATTKRQINQEDSPLEERTLLIGETDVTGNLHLVYSARSDGPGETVEGSELLAAVSFSGALQLVFSHDYGEEASYAIVERSAAGTWTRRWVSRRFSC
jgi:hypothetical protein